MENNWKNISKGILKSELKKRGLTYNELTDKLKNIGIIEKVENIDTKINRGTFSATFFLQCLKAIDCKKLNLEDF